VVAATSTMKAATSTMKPATTTGLHQGGSGQTTRQQQGESKITQTLHQHAGFPSGFTCFLASQAHHKPKRMQDSVTDGRGQSATSHPRF
jgi:hypothetical protein